MKKWGPTQTDSPNSMKTPKRYIAVIFPDLRQTTCVLRVDIWRRQRGLPDYDEFTLRQLADGTDEVIERCLRVAHTEGRVWPGPLHTVYGKVERFVGADGWNNLAGWTLANVTVGNQTRVLGMFDGDLPSAGSDEVIEAS